MASDVESFGDVELASFEPATYSKAFNDAENKKRERVVASIINEPADGRRLLRDTIANKNLFDSVCTALDSAIAELRTMQTNVNESWELKVIRRGGRQYKHDFDLVFRHDTVEVVVPVEFKRTGRVCEQPQFWQPTVRSAGLLQPGVSNYAEYFFDNYYGELQRITGCSSTTREFYLNKVFGTTYLELPFSQLHAFAKTSPSNQNKLKQLHLVSRHEYIAHLLSLDDGGLDMGELQDLLYQQLSKWFLSWDPLEPRFVWEQLKHEELTLTRTVEPSRTRADELKGLVLPTSTGQKISFLQVWRNNPCVKMPAWQVSLSCS